MVGICDLHQLAEEPQLIPMSASTLLQAGHCAVASQELVPRLLGICQLLKNPHTSGNAMQ